MEAEELCLYLNKNAQDKPFTCQIALDKHTVMSLTKNWLQFSFTSSTAASWEFVRVIGSVSPAQRGWVALAP